MTDRTTEIRSFYDEQADNTENIVNIQFSSIEVDKLKEIIGYHNNNKLTRNEFVSLKNVLSDHKKIKIFFWSCVAITGLSVLGGVSQYSRAETISENKAKVSDVEKISDDLNSVQKDIKKIKDILEKNRAYLVK